jgi:predicted nucleotide-binding protein (sugar kinase/HSP70/actin superfamily)
MSDSIDEVRAFNVRENAVKKANPNFVEIAARAAFESFKPEIVAETGPRRAFTKKARDEQAARAKRAELRIGMPRALNMYSLGPLFTGYFESLGIPSGNLVWSDYSSETLYREGAKRGAVDPCFPSKLGIPHVHNLLYQHHKKRPLDYIFFPMIDDLPSDLSGCVAHRACPTVTTTPEAVKAAFTKEGDLFGEMRVAYLDTFVNPGEPKLFERQMYREFHERLGLSERENARAVQEGYKALDRFVNEVQRGEARKVLRKLEEENRLGIVLLGRPYHNDPGINHEILVEFQKLGFPVFTQTSLPLDEDLLERLFGVDVAEKRVASLRGIEDVWKNSYSENTSYKVFAAKYVARHPNLVALELSNFKCGHDAPIYTVVEEIIEASGTPCFSFKDIDENKPTGSIKIRIETISYFLKTYREELLARETRRADVEERLRSLESEMRHRLARREPIGNPDRAAAVS